MEEEEVGEGREERGEGDTHKSFESLFVFLKYLMYAYDTAIFIQAEYETEEAREVLELFEKVSNAKVNWNKCSGLVINTPKPPPGIWGGRRVERRETTTAGSTQPGFRFFPVR